MADESKTLLALLNGISKHDYFDDSELSDEFLKGELYAHLSDEEFRHLIHKCRGIMKNLATMDMDLNQAEAFLSSQAKKREGGITEEQGKVFIKFWKNNKAKIHEKLISNCTWDNTLKNISWRIDLKTRSKDEDNINEPVAIVEMQLANKTHGNGTDVLRFEMDNQSMTTVLKSLKDVEEQIQAGIK